MKVKNGCSLEVVFLVLHTIKERETANRLRFQNHKDEEDCSPEHCSELHFM